MKKALISFSFFFASLSLTNAAISLGGPTVSGWISLGANYDFLSDQQTGDPASDIVGTITNPGFFTAFDNSGTPSLTDGFLGFRIRLNDHGGNRSNISFGRNLWVGVDADTNGSIDALLGLNLQGSANQLGIYSPGVGLNTSPSTTSVASSPTYSYTPSGSTYNYRAVNFASDGGTTNDVGGDGNADYYVSFLIPFADVVAFLNAKSIPINQNTGIRYIVATSSQPNSFNQDLGGVNGQINSSSTWAVLGGFTPIISASGILIPECSPALLAVLGSGLVFSLGRRRLEKAFLP